MYLLFLTCVLLLKEFIWDYREYKLALLGLTTSPVLARTLLWQNMKCTSLFHVFEVSPKCTELRTNLFRRLALWALNT